METEATLPMLQDLHYGFMRERSKVNVILAALDEHFKKDSDFGGIYYVLEDMGARLQELCDRLDRLV